MREKSCGAMAEFFMMYCTGGPECRGEEGGKQGMEKSVTEERRRCELDATPDRIDRNIISM